MAPNKYDCFVPLGARLFKEGRRRHNSEQAEGYRLGKIVRGAIGIVIE